MIHVCTPKAGRILGGGGWVYLGKDAAARRALEELLEQPSLSLKNLLHEESARLRAPFLDFVYALGAEHKDSPAWWAGTLAWKAWGASDLFLLICYQSLCRTLADQAEPLGAPNLTVVLEDPWLFHQVRELLASAPKVSFSEAPPLAAARRKATLLGAMRRLKWALRMGLSRLKQSLFSLRRRPRPQEGAVLIYSHLLDRSLAPVNGWNDHYFPNLDDELKADGCPVARCTYPDTTGYEIALSRRPYVFPLILWASWSGFWRAFLARPLGLPKKAEFAGMPLGFLLERERFHDLSRAGCCAYLLLFDAARRLLSTARWKALILPWEAQPQERMLILAAKAVGVRSIGYQHTTVPRMQLPFFPGLRSRGKEPLPDLLLASGKLPMEALLEGGFPAARLRLGGSRRYAALLSAEKAVPAAAGGDVLLILPIDPFPARHLLAAIARGYPKGGRSFRFIVQPHPAEPGTAENLPFPALVARTPLLETLRSCGTVVFTGSTSGIEAWSLGHPVLRYRPDTLLDVDPCDVFDEAALPTASDADLPRKLEVLRKAPPLSRDLLDATLPKLFAPVDERAWGEAVLGMGSPTLVQSFKDG